MKQSQFQQLTCPVCDLHQKMDWGAVWVAHTALHADLLHWYEPRLLLLVKSTHLEFLYMYSISKQLHTNRQRHQRSQKIKNRVQSCYKNSWTGATCLEAWTSKGKVTTMDIVHAWINAPPLELLQWFTHACAPPRSCKAIIRKHSFHIVQALSSLFKLLSSCKTTHSIGTDANTRIVSSPTRLVPRLLR